jgi:soluble lytic murein transglycosylase-like protein
MPWRPARNLLLLALLAFDVAAQVPDTAWQYRRDMVQSAWRIHGPNAPVATLAAQIHQESGWRIDAVSWAGAQGLAQFMPGTAKDAALRWPSDCNPANPFKPSWAFACRDRYLKAQVAGGLTECDQWAFMFRAYNGGLGWIRKDRKLAAMAGDNPDDWKAVEPYNAGRAMSAWKENTEYPVRIYRLESRYGSWGRELGCLE